MAGSPFTDGSLDEIDRGILHLYQQGARTQTYAAVAERLSVSEGTVRNRLERMERRKIVETYVPVINYENAGAPLRMLFTCTADVDERPELIEPALSIDGVVNVREFTAARGNVRVVGIAADTDDISRISSELASIGLTVDDETLMRQERTQPFDHFGTAALEESD